MTAARRNLLIILLVLGVLAVSLLIIVPGSPISKPTRAGLTGGGSPKKHHPRA